MTSYNKHPRVPIRTFNFASQPGFLCNEVNGLVFIKWGLVLQFSACRRLVQYTWVFAVAKFVSSVYVDEV